MTWSPKESAYVVESLARGQDEATKVQFLANVGRFLSLPYAIGGRPIRGLLDRPSTKVVDAHESVKDGRTLVRVDMELSDPDIDATVDLDPGLGWAVVHGRTHARSGTIPDITWDVVYGPTVGGSRSPGRRRSGSRPH